MSRLETTASGWPVPVVQVPAQGLVEIRAVQLFQDVTLFGVQWQESSLVMCFPVRMPIVNGHHPCEEDGVGAEGDGVLDFEPLEDNRVDFSLVEGRGWQVRWRAVHGHGGAFQQEENHSREALREDDPVQWLQTLTMWRGTPGAPHLELITLGQMMRTRAGHTPPAETIAAQLAAIPALVRHGDYWTDTATAELDQDVWQRLRAIPPRPQRRGFPRNSMMPIVQ